MLIRLPLAVLSAGTAALASGGSVANAATSTHADPAACSTGQLPAIVQGVPAGFHAGQALGDRLYHTESGWHLRVTHPGDQAVVFTGTITSSAGIVGEKVMDEKQDIVRRSADGKTLTFRFVDHGGVDGLDFRTDCARRVSVSLGAAGHTLSPERVWLGAHGAHPTSNPFVVERR